MTPWEAIAICSRNRRSPHASWRTKSPVLRRTTWSGIAPDSKVPSEDSEEKLLREPERVSEDLDGHVFKPTPGAKNKLGSGSRESVERTSAC
eukprot:s2178_g13.t1